MKTFAQILHGKLHWKFEQETAPEFAPEIQIVEITGLKPQPQEGWNWDGQKFSAPSPLGATRTLEENKVAANERIAAYAEAKRKEIAGTADDAEIAGWNNKLRIAQAVVAGTATDADKAAFEGEIAARSIPGETLDIFVQKVLKNAVFYAKAAGIIDGLKRKAHDDVAAAKTPEAVEAVLAEMRRKAESAHAELMKSVA